MRSLLSATAMTAVCLLMSGCCITCSGPNKTLSNGCDSGGCGFSLKDRAGGRMLAGFGRCGKDCGGCDTCATPAKGPACDDRDCNTCRRQFTLPKISLPKLSFNCASLGCDGGCSGACDAKAVVAKAAPAPVAKGCGCDGACDSACKARSNWIGTGFNVFNNARVCGGACGGTKCGDNNCGRNFLQNFNGLRHGCGSGCGGQSCGDAKCGQPVAAGCGAACGGSRCGNPSCGLMQAVRGRSGNFGGRFGNRGGNGCGPGVAGNGTGCGNRPYYTTRGPRDFLMANPPSIGR